MPIPTFYVDGEVLHRVLPRNEEISAANTPENLDFDAENSSEQVDTDTSRYATVLELASLASLTNTQQYFR